MSYRCWTESGDWLRLKEHVLKEVDEAVELGRKHGVHVNLNLHRAPGYCVNPPSEPFSLWKDEVALEACCHHWSHLAKRYRGVPNREVSFDLVNEPANVTEGDYVQVVRRLVEAIRSVDPGRLIVADGLFWGREPVHGLVDLSIAQSTRGYDPMGVSHYRASWVQGAESWPEPAWPLMEGTKRWDAQRLLSERIRPWKALEAKGVAIHVGEWGAFNRTPHPVALAWMKDCLGLWREAGWGWALWNLRGSFGVVDSEREDVRYEAFEGRQLDRRMLELLRSSQ
jgi:endoglucanase